MGFYWSYTLLLKLPVLMRSCYKTWLNNYTFFDIVGVPPLVWDSSLI